MKVVCVNLGENLGYETCIDDITVGKSYDVISQHQDYIIYFTLYKLRNDKGNIILYNNKLFLNLEDWRKEQIDKIL